MQNWRRPYTFSAAGADVLYAPGLHDLDTIQLVCNSVDKPVNVVIGMPGTTFTVDELADAGVKRISVGSALARLAYGSLVRSAKEISAQGSFDFAGDAMGFAELDAYFK